MRFIARWLGLPFRFIAAVSMHAASIFILAFDSTQQTGDGVANKKTWLWVWDPKNEF